MLYYEQIYLIHSLLEAQVGDVFFLEYPLWKHTMAI